MAAKYQPSGVSFLGVDVRDTTASALVFTHQLPRYLSQCQRPEFAIALDFTAKVPIAGTPTTLVVNRTGHVGAVLKSRSQSIRT